MSEDDLLGDVSPVYHSLLEVIFLCGVPYNAALANLMQGVIVAVTTRWWVWLLSVPVIHVGLALITWGDQYRLRKVLTHLSDDHYLHPG